MELVYVNLYTTGAKGPQDSNVGMFTVEKTTRYMISEVERVERGVHLIPKFGNTFKSSDVLRKVEQEKARRALSKPSESMAPLESAAPKLQSLTGSLEVVPEYKIFYLNNQVDSHAYRLLY